MLISRPFVASSFCVHLFLLSPRPSLSPVPVFCLRSTPHVRLDHFHCTIQIRAFFFFLLMDLCISLYYFFSLQQSSNQLQNYRLTSLILLLVNFSGSCLIMKLKISSKLQYVGFLNIVLVPSAQTSLQVSLPK